MQNSMCSASIKTTSFELYSKIFAHLVQTIGVPKNGGKAIFSS